MSLHGVLRSFSSAAAPLFMDLWLMFLKRLGVPDAQLRLHRSLGWPPGPWPEWRNTGAIGKGTPVVAAGLADALRGGHRLRRAAGLLRPVRAGWQRRFTAGTGSGRGHGGFPLLVMQPSHGVGCGGVARAVAAEELPAQRGEITRCSGWSLFLAIASSPGFSDGARAMNPIHPCVRISGAHHRRSACH